MSDSRHLPRDGSVGIRPARRSRALPADIKAMKAIKRAVDALEPHEKQRVMEWANAYVEGVGQSTSARYRMALEAIAIYKTGWADNTLAGIRELARKALDR